MQTPGPPGLSAHWASLVHGTQTWRPVSQMGLPGARLQSALARHSTQLPSGAHTAGAPGARAAHAALPPAAVQLAQLLLLKQKGLVAVEQFWLSTHSTQVPSGSHTGVAPMHAPLN